MKEITLTINGEKRTVAVRDNELLIDLLREKLEKKSVKAACWRGECGLCTVLMNNMLVKSCLVLAVEADDSEIITAEGIASNGLARVQEYFAKYGASQCGFCTPAFVLTTHFLLSRNEIRDEKDIREKLSGIICRCGTYNQMRQAILELIKERT